MIYLLSQAHTVYGYISLDTALTLFINSQNIMQFKFSETIYTLFRNILQNHSGHYLFRDNLNNILKHSVPYSEPFDPLFGTI